MSLTNDFYAPLNYEADVPRAWHNLSTKRSYTVHTGLNQIVYSRRMYQGDEFKITTHSLLQTILPMSNPLFDCFELRLEYYYEPLSNLYGYMDNNTKRSVQENMNTPKHRLQMFGYDNYSGLSGVYGKGIDVLGSEYDTPNYAPDKWFADSGHQIYPGVNKGSLLNHLGLPVGFCGYYDGSMMSNDLPWLGNQINFEEALVYLDIMRSYHINSQVDKTPFCLGLNTLTDDAVDIDDVFSSLDVPLLDKFFIDLRYLSNKSGVNFQATGDNLPPTSVLGVYAPGIEGVSVDGSMPSQSIDNLRRWFGSIIKPYGGWFPTQYRPDLWRNLLAISVGSNSRKVQVRFSENQQAYISIDEFRTENKLQKWIDALDLSGGRYSQVLRTVFGFGKTKRLDIPELLAVTKHLIDPSNITSMTAGYNENSSVDLGQKGANVDKYNKSRQIVVKAHEDGYVMVIASITPLIGYHQNITPNLLRLSMEDDFNPNLQRLSYQDVPMAFYSALPNNVEYGVFSSDPDPLSKSVGKQVAWLDEMTDVNRIYGDFASDFGFERSWVLGRDYTKTWLETPPDPDYSKYSARTVISPYVNPLEHNDIFTSQNIGRAPWALHLSFDIKAKRPIGKRYRPTLD